MCNLRWVLIFPSIVWHIVAEMQHTFYYYIYCIGYDFYNQVVRGGIIFFLCFSKDKLKVAEGTAVIPDARESAKLGLSYSYCKFLFLLLF